MISDASASVGGKTRYEASLIGCQSVQPWAALDFQIYLSVF